MPTESPRESAYSTYHNEVVEGAKTYRVPDVEKPGTRYIPYRGDMWHGVLPTSSVQPELEDENVEGGKVVTGFFEPPAPDTVAPIPVRIVTEASHEYTQWRAYQIGVTSTPIMVVSRKEGRQRVTIRNNTTTVGSTDRIYIGPDNNVSSISGYIMDSRDETVLTNEAEVWACANPGVATPVPISVLLEFSTPQR
jgi:hypothetical protein